MFEVREFRPGGGGGLRRNRASRYKISLNCEVASERSRSWS